MQNYLDGLNEKQKEAVLAKEGPVLILAGAGAGKTKTIAYRILHLIKSGVAPESILAITFTNKAAKEMRDRIHALLSSDSDLNSPISSFPISSSPNTYNLTPNTYHLPFISTFHSLGVHILKENSHILGMPRHFGIFDKSDSLKAVKEAVSACGLDPKTFEPSKIQNIISREKGNLMTAQKFAEIAGNEYFPNIVAVIWKKYEEILQKEKAFDFDDLLLKTAKLLQEHPEIKSHYQNIWKYIHIDEYQDTNKVQYTTTKMLAEKSRNICVVGDGDQCLPPNTKIKTSDGEKKICKIKTGEKVFGASGDGELCLGQVSKVIKNKYSGAILKIKISGGQTIEATPNHALFARLALTPDKFYVYLMYRRDKGFRIGQAKSVRQNSNGDASIGLLVRCNQEKADKMWVLKICDSKREAAYWEVYFSSKYGIPTVVFLTGGRKLAIEQEDINKIFSEIDTRKRTEKLFEETGLSFDYPHYLPQGTTAGNSERDRVNIKLYMFNDRRKSLANPWGMSKVSINTTDLDFKNKLHSAGFKTRKGKRNDWRLEIARLDYGEAEKIAEKILTLKPNLTIVRSAFITTGEKMFFHPASNIIPGMAVAICKKNKVVEEKVVSVERKNYDGYVYDLNVDKIHNYVADNVVVHNSIYSWRGADIKNILDFEKDYPEAKVVVMEENYRSTQIILETANQIIKKNKMRKEKNLFTKNMRGEKIGLLAAYDEADEANFTAGKSKQLIESGVSPSEIAVLYRANFQSRALEEAFLREGVPYQVLGTRFFERKEVKDVVSYLRASLNPDGLSDLKRIINVPARGIGKTTILKIFAGKESELTDATKEKVANFRLLLSKIAESAKSAKVSDTIKFIITTSGIEQSLKDSGADEEERLENARELATFASKYDGFAPEEGIEKFLTDVALASDQDELMKEKGGVKLMTVHAAKGLEFDYVFITGMEEDLFPHKKLNADRIDQNQAEEERRLFYVAITRARKKVFLSYTSVRTIFGSRQINAPSEFVFDIDDNLLEAEERIEGMGKTIYFD